MNKLFLTSITMLMTATVNLAYAQESLRLATMDTGTVNWELDTIKNYGLDQENGFELEVSGMAGDATKLAFESEQADVIVADLVWVLGQNAAGRDYVFLPYSKNVGALVTNPDSSVTTLQDLKGKKIGIAGGPLDKNWLILNAYAQQENGMNLKDETEQVFGAPPLIMKTAISGEVDAALNFWHFQAKMENAGMIPVVQINEIAQALGLDPDTPLLGYVLRRDYYESNPDIVNGLAAASKSAKQKIQNDDAAWNALRERVNPSSDAEFDALRAAFIAGIPRYQPINIDGVNALLNVLSENGGAELVPVGTVAEADIFIE